MDSVSNDYIAKRLAESRQQDALRQVEHDRLVKIALKKIKVTFQIPKINIHHN